MNVYYVECVTPKGTTINIQVNGTLDVILLVDDLVAKGGKIMNIRKLL